ncbi:MAG: hypothetical protein JG718_01195 [Candidatus Thiothrix moscowensis]|nr:hypothetical protein [Candidatus Thiothrix moscowensis]
MVKAETMDFAPWQQLLFWTGWLMLFIPAYFIAHGFSLVGSLVWSGYSADTVDLVLVLIMGTALIEILLVAIHTFTRFYYRECSFKRLLSWLMFGIAVIPLAATLGCLYSYATLALGVL